MSEKLFLILFHKFIYGTLSIILTHSKNTTKNFYMSRTLRTPKHLALNLIVIQLAEKASYEKKEGSRNDCNTDKAVSYWRQILVTFLKCCNYFLRKDAGRLDHHD